MTTITTIKALVFLAPLILAGVFFLMYKHQKQKAMALRLENQGFKTRLKAIETRQKYFIKNQTKTADAIDKDLKDYFRKD